MKNKHKLIPWEQVQNELFTKEEQRESELRVKMKIALRKLRETREKLGLTQSDLAAKSGLTRTTISKVESGYQNATLEKIMQVAAALDKDVEIKLVDRI